MPSHTHRQTLLALLAAVGLLSGCAATRELTLDPPVNKSTPLPTLPGAGTVDGDDFYVQFVTEFEYRGNAEHGCQDGGSSYATGGATSQLMFEVRNETLHFERDTPALSFQSATGRCTISLDAKKVYLTPWMRLDLGKDTQIDYSFVTSKTGGVSMARIGTDLNAASNVLAFTGVGTGVAIMGKIASGWMVHSGSAKPPEASQQDQERRQETRSLPPMVSLGAPGATLDQSTFKVFERADRKFSPLSATPEPVGELIVHADAKPSLLLKIGPDGLPNARDLSLEELWRAQIQTGQGLASLRDFITQAEHPEHPNLDPDANNYGDVETACRKLKIALRDLGFNRYDRNAVLYYFLDRHPDWKNHNVTGQSVLGGEYRLAQLQQFRGRGFTGCLIPEDYRTMQAMGLAVNSPEDWTGILQQTQAKESYFDAIRSLARQLTAALRSPEAGEMEHQLFPLIVDGHGAAGKVLLQDRLGNFGLERLLNTPAVPGEGIIVTAAQLAQVLSNLKLADLSCARPAFAQGQPVRNVAILAFTTAEGSPLPRGGALEYEFDGNRIVRLAIQSPAFRDFREDARNHPDIGDCRIDPALLDRI